MNKEEFDNLAAITEPTEDWDTLSTAYYTKQRRKGKYIKLGLATFIAIPFLSVIYVLMTR